MTKLVPDCMARRSVASLGLEPAAAVGGTITAGMGEGLRRTGGAGRVRCLALSSAPCLNEKNHKLWPANKTDYCTVGRCLDMDDITMKCRYSTARRLPQQMPPADQMQQVHCWALCVCGSVRL